MASGAARTHLAQLVESKSLTTSEFLRIFDRIAAEIAAEEPGTEKAVVTWGTARRWINGEVGLPHPSSCRVLERMFNASAAAMFGPPVDVAAQLPGMALEPAPQHQSVDVVCRPVAPGLKEQIEELTNMAAAESAAFGEFAEQSNVGPHTLEQFRADLERIVTVYPNRPVYPLFIELRTLRDRVFRKLEGRQPPEMTRELYVIAGTVCAVLANASFDLGGIGPAETQARTAYLCGELARHAGLQSWVRGLQALIAFWDDRFRESVNLAEQGWRFAPETGTARVRLASIEARARARLRDERGTEDALARADWARDRVHGPDDPGGMMAFPIAKQSYSAASARLWLGGESNYAEAERLADESLQLYLSDPEDRRRLGEMSLARLDLAVARLSRRDLDGAAEQIESVLETGGQRRVESVGRRLIQIGTALERPYFQTSALATGLRDRIKDSPVSNARALNPGPQS